LPAPDSESAVEYRALTGEFGTAYYTRIEAPDTPEQKAGLEKLSPKTVNGSNLAGEQIAAELISAPSNDAPIGDRKVVARSGRLVARPSGTKYLQDLRRSSRAAEREKSQMYASAESRTCP
jgi:phosphoglucomutase